MWLFTRYGFFSATCARQEGNRKGAPLDPRTIQVRARVREHLDNLRGRFSSLGNCSIEESEGTDYRFRIFVSRAVWAKVMAGLAEETMYDNFKNECGRTSGDSDYNHMLHQVWDLHYDLQVKKTGPGLYGPYPPQNTDGRKVKKGKGGKKGKGSGRHPLRVNEDPLWADLGSAEEASPFRDGEPVEVSVEPVKIEDTDIVLLVKDQDSGYKVGIIRWEDDELDEGTAYSDAVETDALALVAHPGFEKASWGDVKDDWEGSPVF